MFTRDEALAVWDDLIADKDAFLMSFGEVVLTRGRNYPYAYGDDPESFGYFVKAKNHCYTKEMFDGYNRVCEKHKCQYRIETDQDKLGIIFYKDKRP
jgi:hypothetical protein